MAGKPKKPKLVHPDPPKKETEPAKQFDSGAYFKEALALRKPLAPGRVGSRRGPGFE
jgi:hypothetical protein